MDRSRFRAGAFKSRRLLIAVIATAMVALGGAAVLPTSAAAATPPWMDTSQTPAQRASELLAAMSTTDKLAMMHSAAACNGYDTCVAANTTLGIPGLNMMDGPDGVADGIIGVTQLPAPVAAASTFDTTLEKQYGQVIGSEQWGKGVNVVLGPTINIVRDPRWGRAFESFSEDPYLSGQMAAADIQGIQSQGPISEVKHYAVYNQETNRNQTSDNAIVTDRVQREIYLQAFEDAVKQGGALSDMCSYAEINGTFACENSNLMQNILQNQWGFQGFTASDFGATHSTVNSVNNGLDMELPDSTYFGQPLTDAVNSGTVSIATINAAVTRILVAMFADGLFDKTNTGALANTVTSAAHTATAKQVAEEGSVLLKNSSILPVTSATHSIAVIGDDAGIDATTTGFGSAQVNAPYVVTPYQGISTRAGSAATVTYAQGVAPPNGGPIDPSFITPSQGTGQGFYSQFYSGTALAGTPIATRNDPALNYTWGGLTPGNGVPTGNWSAKFTGTLTPPTTGTYNFSLTSDDGSRLFVNGQQIISNWADQPPTTKSGSITLTAGQPATIEVDYFQDGGGSQLDLNWQVPNQNLQAQAVTAATGKDMALVFVDTTEGEGADLPNIDISAAQNSLISAVAAANPNTVVVVNSGSAVTMPWANSVKGIIENWYPGQEDGNAIAALLYGDVNFSGKLPVTFPQSLADVPASTTAQWPGQNGTVQYSEGLDVGYRWYDAQNKTPLYPFGFGLSYTSFAYSNLTVGTPDASGNVAVGFDVKNSGSVAGTEVPQIYVGQPSSVGEPPKNLRSFTRVTVAPGATQHVSATLDARSFQYWNTTTPGQGTWTNANGANAIYVAASSRDIRLTGVVTIGGGGGTTPPTMPGNLTVTGHTSTSVSLSWTASTGTGGVTGYQIRQNGTLVATITGTSYTANGLNPSTAYTFTVTATDAAGNASPAASVSVTTDPSPGGTNVALGKPITATSTNQGFVASNADDSDANTYWESANNVFPQSITVDLGSAQAIDKVIMKLPPSTSWGARTQTVTIAGSTNNTTFTTIVPQATYSFDPNAGANTAQAVFPSASARYVRLTFTANTGWPAAQLSDFEVFTTPGGDTSPPTAPTNLTATGHTSSSVSLSWTASTDNVGVVGYQVFQGATLVGTPTGTSFTVSGLAASTAYSFTVKAYDAVGNASAASNTVNVTTDAGTATNLALGKMMSSSGYTQTYAPSNTNDGNTGTYWESTDNAFPQWLQVDLGSSTSVKRVVLTLPPGWGARNQTIAVAGSTDGSTFSTLAGAASYPFDPNSTNTVTINFTAATARYVRLTFTANTGWPAGQISEFQVWAS